jgi:mannose-6-phosphate isomerase-like protein (cupin superfamily)
MTHPSPSTPIYKSASSLDGEIVEDYLISSRDDPERPAVYASGDIYTFLATSSETDLSFNFFDFFVPVLNGPPPHVHPGENETWYVTDGKLQFNLGDEGKNSLVVPEESVIFGPQDRIHGFRNLDSTASISGLTPGARALSFTNPGNLDLFFDAISPRVIDENQAIPAFEPTDEDFQRIREYSIRTGAGITFPDANYTPPDNTPDYVLVLPEDATEEEAQDALALSKLDGFQVWTTGEQSGIAQRATFVGDFGLEYTSLLTLEETRNEFSYDQFSLASQTAETTASAHQPEETHTEDHSEGAIHDHIEITAPDFTESIVSEDYKAFYVTEGTLSLQINGEAKLVEANTLAYVAPGNEYSIANLGTEPVESLAMTIPVQPEPERTILSPLASLADVSYQNVFLGDEADIFAPPDESDREVHGQNGNDQLSASQGDRLLGEEGDDLLNASSNGSQNLLDGGLGNDELLGGKDSELVGREGDDILRIGNGGNNLLYGNGGADQFWLANNTVPDTVIEDRQLTDLGLPVLTDTKNTIVDFESGVDRIGISGLPGVSSFEDLKLLPAFGDIRSTSIVAEVEGVEGEISLGNVVDVYFNELSAEDFVFA